MMRTVLVVLASLDFVGFGIALRVIFAAADRTPVLTRLMVFVGSAVGALHVLRLAMAPLHDRGAIAGAALYIVGGVLFAWASYSIRGRDFRLAYVPGTPAAVFSRGPYRWVRHPFYLSYTLAWIAGVVALWDAHLLLTAGVMLGFYVGAAWREERQMLRGRTAEAYRAYRQHAGMLLPRFDSCPE
jgi:protein-S-isoprenylcysteine O-methyltransferase Ste14